MATIRVGTRGSRLALAQAGWVADRLREVDPSTHVEVQVIRTSGDLIKDVPLGPQHGQSFFTKEIEDALSDGRVDVAVHSCKDLATRLPPGLSIGALPPREDPRDVLVARVARLSDLAAGATVGTSSIRRKRFLARIRPDLSLCDQRGNVPTRVQALDDGRLDAVVLAAAGLIRLGLGDRITEYLEPEVMLPAAGQGALALQVREADVHIRGVVSRLDHAPTRAAVEAERACLRRLEAGCQAPVGALGHVAGSEIVLDAAVVSTTGVARTRVSGPAEASEAVGRDAAEELLRQLGLASLREADWAGSPPRGPGRRS